jgi:AcrR family transcriptional regulator
MTMAAVAERAGISRRAVYLHFPSRVDLINALFDHVNAEEDLAGSLAPVWAAPDATAALDEWARHLARYAPRVLPVSLAVERVGRTDPDAAGHWTLAVEHRRSTCSRVIARLAVEDLLAGPWTVRTGTDMMLALVSNDVLRTLIVDCAWSEDRLAGHLSALFRATFAARPSPA